MSEIDNAAYAAADANGDLSKPLNRIDFFAEILIWHAQAEEESVFPVVDRVAPLVARAYYIDHRELDKMTDGLSNITASSDRLVTARATASLYTHLRVHLDKEDVHLYPVLSERTSLEEQASIVGAMSRKIPPDRMPEAVGWMFPLLSDDDRETMTRVWMDLMPEQTFTMVKGFIHAAIAEDWAELAHRIPELA
jgi:zinc finger-like protein